MLTGSYAMAYYATPRMTRDLDLVVALQAADVPRLSKAFAADFYLDADAAREAVQTVSSSAVMEPLGFRHIGASRFSA